MTCKDFEELIALDVAGDLPASEAAPVQAHLHQCSSCRDFAGELSADLEWVQSAHQEAPDPAVLHQVRVGVMRQLESERSRWTPPFGGIAAPGWRWQWVIAAAAVAIVVGSLAWWNTPPERPQDRVVGSNDPYRKRPEIERAPFDRQAGPAVAKADPPVGTSDKASAAIPSSPATRESAPEPAVQGSDTRPARSADHKGEAREDPASAPQVASVTPSEAPHDRAPEPSFETLGSKTNLEIVTARLEEPQQAPEEAVMLKIPTSNPNVVVYWLMDEEQQPEEIEENKGD